MENQEAYERAKKRVEAKQGFYIHLLIYIVVGILLVFINLSTDPQHYWFMWPLIGWGIGVLFHAVGVFIFYEGSSITERMVEKEMEKEASKKR